VPRVTQDVLERASAVNSVLFDKTGTLTTGQLSVARILLWGEHVTEAALMRAVGSAERGSEHPIAKALTTYAPAAQPSMAPTAHPQ
jgi:Cu+-exporting ATPase